MTVPSDPGGVPLLPDEAGGCDVLEDVEHWAAVYEELIEFLGTMRPADSSTMRRLRARLEYWRRRRHELASSDRLASGLG